MRSSSRCLNSSAASRFAFAALAEAFSSLMAVSCLYRQENRISRTVNSSVLTTAMTTGSR